MIEQARVDELERNRRIEAEKFAIQIAEIAAVRESFQSLMKKYGLTEDQLLHGQVRVMNKSNSSMSVTPSKKLSLQEMRTFYSNL